MNGAPAFFLTGVGEYRPLEEPRACWILDQMNDMEGAAYLLVDIDPEVVLDGRATCRLLITSRVRGVSVDAINSWPVLVSVAYGDKVSVDGGILDKESVRSIAWAKLYETRRGAMKDVQQHAVAAQKAASRQIIRGDLEFTGEQVGQTESHFKADLTQLFEADGHVWRAYLARARLGASEENGVVLCIRSATNADASLARTVLDAFSRSFAKKEALNVVFINLDQERALQRVCKPFYVRTFRRRV